MTKDSPMRSNIASAINVAYAGVEAAKREGARHAVECGQLLAQAKATVPHGSWDAWLRLNTKVSPRTAQLYMRIARHVEGDAKKAQRVAGLSVREAAAEASKAKARKPLSPEAEAQVAEMKALWDEATPHPHWKERFVRELYKRGELTLEQRNRIIKGAWNHPDLLEFDREEAAREMVEMLRRHLPEAKLQVFLPVEKRMPGEDMVIALGDEIERRQGAEC